MNMFVRKTRPAVLPTLSREMDRFFSDVWGGRSRETHAYVPAVDVRETEEAIDVTVELPGIDPKNVEISIEGDLLEIKGEKTVTRETEEKARWHRFERRSGKFSRSFQLPAEVDREAIEAKSADGLLSLRLPKKAEAQPKRIDIQVG